MSLFTEEERRQDGILREAFLELLPELAQKNGIPPSVIKAMAARLLLPTQPAEIPEEAWLPEPDPAPEDLAPPAEEAQEVLLPPHPLARLEEQLGEMAKDLQQLQEREEAGQKELAALRRAMAEFSAAEKDAAADRVLLSVIRVLDIIEAALRPEDEEKIEALRRESSVHGAELAHHYRAELQGVQQDLLELLYQNDVEPFTCGGPTLDPLRQQVLARKTAAYFTDCPEGEMLLQSRRPGYARGEQILRREQVWAIQVLPRWMGEELANGQPDPPDPR